MHAVWCHTVPDVKLLTQIFRIVEWLGEWSYCLSVDNAVPLGSHQERKGHL